MNNKRFSELVQEYNEVQKEFDIAVENKCAKCIDKAIRKMTIIDMEQARILHQPLNSRPELNLTTRG